MKLSETSAVIGLLKNKQIIAGVPENFIKAML